MSQLGTRHHNGVHVSRSFDDPLGRLTAVANNGAPLASTFTYDSVGRLESFYTGAVKHSAAFDAQNRATHLWTTGLVQGPNLDLSYGYDRAGNVSQVNDGGTLHTFGSANGAEMPLSLGILNDPNVEPSEQFSVRLAPPVGGVLGASAAATVTILDDDTPPSRAWTMGPWSRAAPAL